MRHVMTGNYAAAYGAKLARAEVIAAYPITPQTSIIEKLADFISAGVLRAKVIPEERGLAMNGGCIAAEAAGGGG